MDGGAPQKGLESTEKLLTDFQHLLSLLGKGNLLFDKSKNKSPSDVPEKCENTNKAVAGLLTSMKCHLSEIQTNYNICIDAVKTGNQPTIDNLKQDGTVKKSPEYLEVEKALRLKNEELKVVIDQMRDLWSVINQFINYATT